MASASAPIELSPAPPKAAARTGWILSGVVIAFLLMDSTMKLLALPIVTETQAAMGWPGDAGSARILGILLLACTLLYVVPRTSVLGAILLTAYLGGAVATHARIASPLLTHTLFGVYVGAAAWAGLYLRNRKLRELIAN